MKRFELVRFSDGAVLVDYGTGAFYRVDGRARGDWARLLAVDARLVQVPHLVLAQGFFVLHASAVQEKGGIVAFCGASGAGKTTLARRRKRLVSEDLVVLDGLEVLVDAEPRLRAWATRGGPFRASSILRGSAREPLRSIAFVEVGRRAGARLRLNPLLPSEAFARLLAHSFAESGDRRIWRRIVAASRQLAAKVPCADATAPLLTGARSAVVLS